MCKNITWFVALTLTFILYNEKTASCKTKLITFTQLNEITIHEIDKTVTPTPEINEQKQMPKKTY